MVSFGLVDGIVPEPIGGAHWDYDQAAANLKKVLIDTLKDIKQVPAEERVRLRIEKFSKMGFWDELPV